MARRVIDVTRRQLLVGIGGATLALPVLPSLLTKTAFGQDPTYTRQPRLFWVTTDHGGAFESSMFPDQKLLTGQTQLFSDHTVRHGALSGTSSGSNRVVSKVLSGSATRFSEALMAKMNVLYGLDVPFYIAHNTGLHLGNYARNNGDGNDGKAVQGDPRPTIDQLLAWSSSFYPDLGSIKERAMVMGSQQLSFNWSNPSSRSGNIENVRGNSSSRDLFDRVFVAPGAQAPMTPQTPARAPVVDKVLESYRSLRNGNRRLSAADKQRLDDHMDRLAELERKLTTTAPPIASGALCDATQQPSADADSENGNNPTSATRWGQLFNDVVVAAFACGSSRIGVMGFGSTQSLVSYNGDWHHDVAHMWQNAEPQELLATSYQRFFEGVFLDLAAKLDVEEAPGMTYLDNSLLVWSQESGMETHGTVSVPIVTFGSAAGFFKTGQFVDYRRTTGSGFDPGAGNEQYCGLLYGQWLATVMRSMGLQPAEWEQWDHKGYGVPFLTQESWTPPYRQHYENTSSRYFSMSSDALPVISA